MSHPAISTVSVYCIAETKWNTYGWPYGSMHTLYTGWLTNLCHHLAQVRPRAFLALFSSLSQTEVLHMRRKSQSHQLVWWLWKENTGCLNPFLYICSYESLSLSCACLGRNVWKMLRYCFSSQFTVWGQWIQLHSRDGVYKYLMLSEACQAFKILETIFWISDIFLRLAKNVKELF